MQDHCGGDSVSQGIASHHPRPTPRNLGPCQYPTGDNSALANETNEAGTQSWHIIKMHKI